MVLFRGRQQVTICVIGAVITCVFIIFWYLPLSRKASEIRQAKAKRALTIVNGTADAGKMPLLLEQIHELQAKIGDFEASIPDRRAHGGFLQRITDLMRDHDLKDEVIEPGVEMEADKFTCIPVGMECKGELAQISEFYHRLQSLDRLVRIEKVTLTNDQSYSGQVTMKTEAVVYYRAKAGQDHV